MMTLFESDDRGITRELVSPSLGETESWIGVVQFIQSQPQDAGLSDSDTIVYNTHDHSHTGGPTPAGERRGAQWGGPERRRGAQWRRPKRQRQDRTPSVASVLLGLTQKDGSWVTTEMPAENREAIMNDRSATLVHHGLKQPKSDVVTALATSATSSFHAVRWIIDSKDW